METGAPDGELFPTAKGVRMANGEKKGDVARALIAHVLNVTSAGLAERDVGGRMLHLRTIGRFQASHMVAPREGEIVDVWQGGKVFSARRKRGAEDWELVSFKRGDWESGFLCAA
jgi:hypothetical protein